MTQDTQLPLDLGLSAVSDSARCAAALDTMPDGIAHSRDLRAQFISELPAGMPTEMRRLLDHAFACGAASHTEQIGKAFGLSDPLSTVRAVAALDIGAHEELRHTMNALAPGFVAPTGDSSHTFNYDVMVVQ